MPWAPATPRPRRERPEGPPADPAQVAAEAEKFLVGLAASIGATGETVVNIQGDEPLIEPALIDDVARALAEDASWDMATAAAPITQAADVQAASVVKVVWDREGRAADPAACRETARCRYRWRP